MKWAIGLVVILLVVLFVVLPWYRKHKANRQGKL